MPYYVNVKDLPLQELDGIGVQDWKRVTGEKEYLPLHPENSNSFCQPYIQSESLLKEWLISSFNEKASRIFSSLFLSTKWYIKQLYEHFEQFIIL